MGTAITVEGLRKTYGSLVAVEDVSFEVAAGEIFGVLGPNGSGKTTTVECVQGLRPAGGGRIEVLGLDPRSQRHELRQRIGSQLQEAALPDRIKVWEALRLFASLTPGAVDWAELVERWGLEAKREATFASLSGGQRQRLFVALALVNQPEVVFLDEMTTGLDPAARRETWGLIEAIRDQGTTVVLVTHFMDEAKRLCDRLAVVKDGRVLAMGTPSALVAAHTEGIRASFSTDQDMAWLEGVPHVRRVARRGRRVEVEGDGPVLVHLGHALLHRGLEPDDLRVAQPTLEDVYLRLTGSERRERAHAGRDDLGRDQAVRP